MNRWEARQIVDERTRELRGSSLESLTAFFEPSTEVVRGPSGASYQLEIQAFWNDEEGGRLRVVVSADDGGFHALMPVTADFLVEPSEASGSAE